MNEYSVHYIKVASIDYYVYMKISLSKVSVMEFIEDEILKKREREKLQRERKERLEDVSQVKVKTDR